MTKKEYIDKFGEEAYQRYLENVRQRQKKYYNNHKEKLLKKQKEYYAAHIVERRQKEKEYWKTQKGRAARLVTAYNQNDKAKGFDISNNVDYSYIVKRIFTSKCIYCGDDNWEHLGCDRIDNTKPHTPDNVVPCCGICNTERSDKRTVGEMIEYRTTNPRILRNLNAPIEKTPTGAIKKRVFTVIG